MLQKRFSTPSAAVALFLILPLLLALFAAPRSLAAEQTKEPEQAPTITGSDPGPGFPFLGVNAQAKIDPTRKTLYEDYELDALRYCTGCWCNNVFGDRLNESWNELVGKSEAVETLWQDISRCIDPLRNQIPQIRTVPLTAKYDDVTYKEALFYFSEFLDRLLAVRLQVNNPEEYLETLRKRFGEPVSIDDTWHVWQRPGAILVFDLFKVKRYKDEQGELLAVYSEVLDAHIDKAREIERVTR